MNMPRAVLSSRRVRRLHFFEIFTAANLVAIALFAWETLPILRSPVKIVGGLVLSMVIQAALGVGVRAIVALVRRDRGYFRIICSRAWLIETARIVVGFGLIIFTYGWIKLVIPIKHPVLLDQALWDLDQTLFLGVAPSVFFLNLFGGDAVLRAVDWSYANIFFASTLIANAYFFSEPSRRIRVAFSNGYAVLWLTGAWLYMLVPSIGPAYRFHDVWMPHGETLRITQALQALLMRNYRNVTGGGGPVSIVFGIAAFPSLHVAFQMFVCLWMRRLWRWGEVLFAVFVVVIFLGSMITGWHYFVDGVAGLILGYVCYRVFFQRSRVLRFLELRRH
jgi:hypothetical protein